MPGLPSARPIILQPKDASIRYITLTKGQVAIVDADDFDWLNSFTWTASWQPNTESYYARRALPKSPQGKQRSVVMHREILGLKPGDRILGDHWDGDTLNNRRSNLRKATYQQNVCNRKVLKTSKTGLKGSSLKKKLGRFCAQISSHGKKIHIGYFSTAEEAHYAYIAKAKELHREFARG